VCVNPDTGEGKGSRQRDLKYPWRGGRDTSKVRGKEGGGPSKTYGPEEGEKKKDNLCFQQTSGACDGDGMENSIFGECRCKRLLGGRV